MFENFGLSLMRASFLIILVLAASHNQTLSVQLIVSDLVYVTQLRPQKRLENAQNAAIFNESFGWVDGCRPCKNLTKTCQEFIIRSSKHLKKRLAIRRKYLKLIPQIQIHDTANLSPSEMQELYLDLTSYPNEYVYYPEWHYDALKSKYRLSNFTQRIIEPVVLERYPTLRVIQKIRSKIWVVFEELMNEDSILVHRMRDDWLLAFIHFAHPLVVKEILFTSKRSLDSRCSNKIIDKLSRMHNERCEKGWYFVEMRQNEMFGFLRNFLQNGYFDGYPILRDDACNFTKCANIKCKLLKILDCCHCSCRRMLIREIWRQIKIWSQNYEKQMAKKYGSNDWMELLCFDVAMKYQQVARDGGRILHVVLPRDMNADVIRKRMSTFLDSKNKKYVNRREPARSLCRRIITPTKLIIEPYSRTQYCVRVGPVWVLWVIKKLWLVILCITMSYGIIYRPWIERINWFFFGIILYKAGLV